MYGVQWAERRRFHCVAGAPDRLNPHLRVCPREDGDRLDNVQAEASDVN